ncbi:MAG: EAL domain-containing protein [Ruminococcus sp.]|nr:EAL domain-containing protein [Ruminococcus sp.]
MNTDRIKRLDKLFDAFSVIAEGNYVYVCDMREDLSRWSQNAVDYFDLPDVYIFDAGSVWEECIHPDDRKVYRESIEKIFKGEDLGHDMQYRALAGDGNYVICTCRGVVITDDDGIPEYFAGSIRNHGSLSYIDTITGLRSLYGFFDDIKTMLRKKSSSAVIMIGTKGFSSVNDVYGYSFGNKVLINLSAAIVEKFSSIGTVYRLDGTKFAVISSSMDTDMLADIYHSLQEYVSHDLYIDGERVSISLNAGLIAADDFEIGHETLYSCLKYAYYESKDRHLGELVIFEDSLSGDDRHFIEQINTIRSSIVNDCEGFYLCYQPIINAASGTLRGAEALIRWRNDRYGSVSPVRFIPILEQDILFPELGKWIMRQAMTECRKLLHKYPDFRLNINISYAQLEKRDFIYDVFSIIRETGYPKENLCFEMTERCRLLDKSILRNTFDVFRQHKIKIAIDDFGTGFASIGVLRDFKVDTVKIDREYVKNITTSVADQNTVSFISSLADAFSADVCVEGVEDESIRDCLVKYKIKGLQGYYYSKPVVIGDFCDRYL